MEPSRRRRFLRYAAASTVASLPAFSHALPERTSPRAPTPIANRGYRLVKDWDFSDRVTTLDRLRDEFHTRYVYAGGTLDHLNDEWQRYRDNGNHTFEDGQLSLVARRIDVLKPGGIESGMLRSKWSGQYGYFEARIRVPRGRGMWPAFWLNPQDQRWPPEIDVVEIVNNGRDGTRNSFHFLHGKEVPRNPPTYSLLDAMQSYRSPVDFAEGLHTFAIEWTPSSVRHFVDDTLILERPYRWQHDDGTEGGPAHVLLNLAVGGKWPGPPLSELDFPARMQVAFIRVWQV